jgi:PIN domain nuclease of toxin-antitoxin system
MKLLLDTHIWIWHLMGSKDLPKHFREVMAAESTELWLSPISVWEAVLLGEKGRLKLKPNPFAWVRQALLADQFQQAAITNEIAIISREISLPHEDPADRIIAATAVANGFFLATCDERLLKGKEWQCLK